jgi:hypothetical protein
MGLSRGDAALLREAFAAEDRTPLRGPERHGRLLPTLRADGASLDAIKVMSIAHGLGGSGENGHPLRLAVLAALGFVLEILVAEENLFPGGKDEVVSAIDAAQHLILKFH